MLELTKEQFKDQLDKEKLQSRISSLVGFEKEFNDSGITFSLENYCIQNRI